MGQPPSACVDVGVLPWVCKAVPHTSGTGLTRAHVHDLQGAEDTCTNCLYDGSWCACTCVARDTRGVKPTSRGNGDGEGRGGRKTKQKRKDKAVTGENQRGKEVESVSALGMTCDDIGVDCQIHTFSVYAILSCSHHCHHSTCMCCLFSPGDSLHRRWEERLKPKRV